MSVAVLHRDGVLRLNDGHPWLFEDHVASAEAEDGALVRLEGPAGRPRGWAVLSAGSRIRLRVVSRETAELAPGFWKERLRQALARRIANDNKSVVCEGAGSRLVHAEADGLPGLIVDRYGGVAVLQAGCRWADEVATPLAVELVEKHGLVGVLARHEGSFRKHEGLAEGVAVLAGQVPPLISTRISNVAVEVDPWHGQKTGSFLDQRENQVRAAELLSGRCLDAFCGEGGFAIHLALAGAEVTALDSSEPALLRARRNAELNGVAVAFERANVFDRLRELVEAGERFDGIVLDPPALAKRRSDVTSALRGYKELNLRALRLLRPGGRLVTCSCSFHVDAATFLGTLREAAADARADVVVRETRGAASCHPALLTFPESAYLKVAVLERRP